MRCCLIVGICLTIAVRAADQVSTTVPPVVQGDVWSVAVDSSGNQYIAGIFSGTRDFNPRVGEDTKSSAGGTDAFVTRINADGSYGWTRTFGGSGSDGGYGVSVSGSTVFVIGEFSGTADLNGGSDPLTSAGGLDTFVLALSTSDGTQSWKQKFGGTGTDSARGVASAGGKVFVIGLFTSTDAGIAGTGTLASAGDWDAFIIALNDSNGSETWKRSFGSNQYDAGLAIAATASAVYATGEFGLTANIGGGGSGSLTSTGGANAFILAFNAADATPLWQQQFGGNPGNDVGRGIEVSGNTVFVTGSFEAATAGVGGSGTLSNSGGANAFIVALDAANNGAEVWKKKFGGGSYDKGRAISVSGSAVFVSGELASNNASLNGGTGSLATTGGIDAFALAMNASDGSEIWKQKFGGSQDDFTYGIASNSSSAFVSGILNSTDASVAGAGTISNAGFGGFLLNLDTTTGKQPQSITFNTFAGKAVTDSDFDPGATASSGLNVTYMSSNNAIATIVSNKVHIVSTGTVTITASQPGNAGFSAANDVSQSLTITAGLATVTLDNLNQKFDGAPKPVGVTTNPPDLAVSITYNGDTTAPTNAGTYAVVATVTDPNYQGLASGTLIIRGLPTVSATASPQSGTVPLVVSFTGTGVDFDGNAVTYTWNFAEGTNSDSQNPSHTFSLAGTYNVTLTVTDAQSLVNTSVVVVTVLPAGGALPGNADSDADGFSDAIETALNSNPFSAASTPNAMPTPFNAGEPGSIRLRIKLNFKKANYDSIDLQGVLAVSQINQLEDKVIILNTGGVVKQFVLDAKGKAKTLSDTITTKVVFDKTTQGLQHLKFKVKSIKGSFSLAFADDGFANADITSLVTVPVTVIFNNQSFMAAVPQSYKAKTGKTGISK